MKHLEICTIYVQSIIGTIKFQHLKLEKLLRHASQYAANYSFIFSVLSVFSFCQSYSLSFLAESLFI